MNQYFDPKKYYRLLENKYNCNIYLFNEKGMIIPDHVENYLRYYKRYIHSIFIYEHLGSESDNAKYPQCEILTGIDPNIGVTTQFYQLPYVNSFSIEMKKFCGSTIKVTFTIDSLKGLKHHHLNRSFHKVLMGMEKLVHYNLK